MFHVEYPTMPAGKITATAVTLVALIGFTLPAAGGHDCRGYGSACFEKVRLPDAYRTVERPVMVRPPVNRVVHVPALVGTRLERELVAPGRVHAVPVPPVYGTVMRREMVAPATVTYRTIPPVVRSVREEVLVRPGHARWVHKRDRHGREIKCLERSRPVTPTVARQVVVHPGARVPVVAPAIYRDVPRTVIMRPAGVRHVVEPAITRLVERPVIVRPAHARIVTEPPVWAVERQRVRVRSGGYTWRRLSHR
jgi:hypothetical protein